MDLNNIYIKIDNEYQTLIKQYLPSLSYETLLNNINNALKSKKLKNNF